MLRNTEAKTEKEKRIAQLEADPELWFRYYFPGITVAPPADFHKAATRRVINNPEWFEVRSWSRELAKSTRTFLEVMYLVLAKKSKRSIVLVSHSYDNAVRLLQPYKMAFEKNRRIINDYGQQHWYSTWEKGNFIINGGASFFAVGEGQSPCGVRNDSIRPDLLIIDDIDTEENCRNTWRVEKRWQWLQETLIPIRSVSRPFLILFCGNIIAEDCCVLRAQKYADHVDVINIRDSYGKSTWPERNKEEAIDKLFTTISFPTIRREYFNMCDVSLEQMAKSKS